MESVSTIGIRGAGLSGLSAARELLRINPRLKISIFDTRQRLPHPQRTFCFFQGESSNVEVHPAHSWGAILLRGTSFERKIDVSSTPYRLLRGDDFFDRILCFLESAGVEIRWGCSDVLIEGNSIRLGDEAFNFDRVIDAAFDARVAKSSLWQIFGGVWVETQQPNFDPTTAILMDLRQSSVNLPVSFLYILPTSTNRALVEYTTFSAQIPEQEYHHKQCIEWLRANVTGDYEILEYERGSIPMGLTLTRATSGIVVGGNSGTVRPATGYAYLSTQRQARNISSALLLGTRRRPRSYPIWLEWGDRLFLRALKRNPEAGRDLLDSILANAPAAALIPFLSGCPTIRQALMVWMSVPKLKMIRSLFKSREVFCCCGLSFLFPQFLA